MRRIFIAVLAIIALLGILYYVKNSQKEVHFHSGFQIYIDGKLQNYSDPKYMSLIPCTSDNGKIKTHDKVHLHDGVGNVVPVHQPNVIWQDLFDYIKLTIPRHTPVIAYVNGRRVNDIAEEEIEPYDSLVFLIGKHGNIKDYLKNALSKNYIHDMETRNGLCKG